LDFTKDRFEGYLWKMGNTIIISLVISLTPNQGHFSDLLGMIWRAGYRIQVPTPSNIMRRILERKCFCRKSIYDENYQEWVEVYERSPLL